MSRSSVVFGATIILQIVGGILAEEDAPGEVDPCTDFVSYACKVRNSTEEPYVSTSSKRQQMDEFIENYPLKVTQLSEAEEKFYKFRKYCSNTTVEDKKNFIRTFNPSVGGWPAFDKNWKADNFDLQAALAELHSSVFPTIFMIRLQSNQSSFINQNQIHVTLKITDDLYLDEYKQLIQRKLSTLIDNLDEVISDSLIVEGLYVAEKNVTDDDKDVLTNYKGLKEEIPDIDWDKQLETIYGQNVPDTFPVKIHKLALMKRIIRKIFEVEPKVMANYLLYRIARILRDFDERASTELFEHVIYQMIIKQHYAGEIKEELRGMLFSFLNTSANTFNIGHQDKHNMDEMINEFVMDEIVPFKDDSYYDNLYKNITVSEGDCYSTAMQLVKIYVKLLNNKRFQRKVDPLYEMNFQLINTIKYRLINFLDEPSAIRFKALTLNSLEIICDTFRKPKNFKSMWQCLEKQIGQEFTEYEMEEVLQYQILTKAYFDWAKNKADLMQFEGTKYGDSSIKIILERLTSRYCKSESSQEKRKISGVFANFKEVSDVYNCPIGSPLNPQSKCEFV